MRQRKVDAINTELRDLGDLMKAFTLAYPSDPSRLLAKTVHSTLLRVRMELNTLDDYYRRKELEKEGINE